MHGRMARRGAVAVLVWAMVLPRGTWGAIWDSLDWNNPDSPLKCCDAINVYETDDNSTYHGLPFSRFYANASNTATCAAGFQCIPCLPGIRTVFPRCQTCADTVADGGGGVCMPCLLGDYCPNGTVNSRASSGQVLCPDGEVCTPDIQGFNVEDGWTLKYNTKPCPEGTLCPAGSSEVSLELGLGDCQTILVDVLRNQEAYNVSDDAPSGRYCPAGTSPYDLLVKNKHLMVPECKEGFYCPNASAQIECPKGFFCKRMVARPRDCPGRNINGKKCDGVGSTKPDPAWDNAVVILVCFLLLVVFGYSTRMALDIKASHKMKKLLELERNSILERHESSRGIRHTNLTAQLITNLQIVITKSQPFFDAAEVPITISFSKLGLSIGGVQVLTKVSGVFRHSRMIGIMGPSGCGKTTLMNTLCGRALYGTRRGAVLINNEPLDLPKLKTVMGFVPQDDTVFGDLTVRENISYSCRLRTNYDLHRRRELTNGVLSMMNLVHIQSSLVGTVQKRGISGGQKKRVNIGMELAANPTVLFMDEPTSGLAATDSGMVIEELHSFTSRRRTIVAVIHQPRYTAFMLFNDIMLLIPGGHTVYLGPAYLMEDYFTCLGFFTPTGENPADYFLDVVSGIIPVQNDPDFEPLVLCDIWSEIMQSSDDGDVTSMLTGFITLATRTQNMQSMAFHRQKVLETVHESVRSQYRFSNPALALARVRLQRQFVELDVNEAGEVPVEMLSEYLVNALDVPEDLAKQSVAQVDKDASGGVTFAEFFEVFDQELAILEKTYAMEDFDPYGQIGRMRLGKIRLFAVLLKRTLMQKIRMHGLFLQNLSTIALFGLAVGVLLDSDHQPFVSTDTKLTLMMSLIMAITMTLSAVSSLQPFGVKRVLLVRERRAGLDMLALFVAKCLVDMADNLWQPLFFLGVCYNWVVPDQSFLDFYITLVCISFTGSGIGIMMSMVLDESSMTITTVLLSLCMGIFLNGSIGVTMDMAKAKGLGWMWDLSFPRWGQEALMVQDLIKAANFDYQTVLIQQVVSYYGYFPPDNSIREYDTVEERNAKWDTYTANFVWWARLVIFCNGLAFRGFAYLIMTYTGRIGAAWAFLTSGISNMMSRKIVKRKTSQEEKTRGSATYSHTMECISVDHRKHGSLHEAMRHAMERRSEWDRANVYSPRSHKKQQRIPPRSPQREPAVEQANTLGAAQTAMRDKRPQLQDGGGGGAAARRHWGAAYDDSGAEWGALAVLETPEQSSARAAWEFRAPFSSGTEQEAFSMSMDEISLRL